MGDDIGSGSVTDCLLRSFLPLFRHTQQCRAAGRQKSKQMQPELMSSPINYPAQLHLSVSLHLIQILAQDRSSLTGDQVLDSCAEQTKESPKSCQTSCLHVRVLQFYTCNSHLTNWLDSPLPKAVQVKEQDLRSRHGSEKITLLLCTKTYGEGQGFSSQVRFKVTLLARPCGHISSMAGDCGMLAGAGTTEALPSNHAREPTTCTRIQCQRPFKIFFFMLELKPHKDLEQPSERLQILISK